MAITATPLVEVPDEVLLEIAKNVEVKGLLALSLTCRRLRHIGQEALIRQAVLSPIHIWKLVATLLIRPGLRASLTHLRLGPMSQEVHDEMMEYSSIPVAWKLFFMYYPGADRDAVQSNWYFSAGLAVLLALAPRLRGISMGTNSVDRLNLLSDCIRYDATSDSSPLMPNWLKTVRSLLEERLEVFHLFDEESLHQYTSHPVRRSVYCRVPIDVVHFQRLKHIEMSSVKFLYGPSRGRGRQSWLQFAQPLEMLPASVKSVVIYHKFPYEAVQTIWFSKFLEGLKELLNLREVELRFSQDIWAIAEAICFHSDVGEEVLATLRDWEGSNIVLT